MGFRNFIRALFCSGVVLGVLASPAPALNAQGVDVDGFILSEMWLVLGPFRNDFGCGNSMESFLGNHIAPAHIACQYPAEGDDIEYDPVDAISDGYIPDFEDPVWRLFDEFGGSRDLNLDGDINGDVSDAMSWLVTYVEYTGEAPVVVEICAGSDDDNQIWVNETHVATNIACRPRGECQDTVAAVFEPGVNRIAFGIWENGGGWGGSLALRLNGEPINEDTDDFVFLGVEGGEPRPDCEGPELEDLLAQRRVVGLTCAGTAEGIALTWGNPPENDETVEIRVINGAFDEMIPGDSTSLTIPDDQFDPEASICVINYSGLPSCCSLSATTDIGQIKSTRWLVLGPFQTTVACDGNPNLLLANHIAPAVIGCEYPRAGDPIEYDPLEAATNGYVGPEDADGFPFWRPFDDGSDDGDHNLDADAAGPQSQVMSWLVTYVEYTGADPVDIELCVGSDDDVQVWINQDLVHNMNRCAPQGDCQDRVPYTIPGPGVYRIAMGVWEEGGGWAGRFGLELDGLPILDDGTFDEWIFHGRSPPADFVAPECVGCPPDPVRNLTCELGTVGFGQGLILEWENPETTDLSVPTEIAINGQVVREVPSDATSARLPSGVLPDGVFVVTVTHCGGVPASCSPFNVNEFGFVSTWLHLGPFAQQDGASPGCDLMRLDHLTDGETSELDIEPVAGDQIETDYSPGAAASLGLNPAEACPDCNPDGIPTWQAFTVGDQFDVNANVSSGDNQMSYGMFYIDVVEDITVDIGVASDDAIQVLAAPVGDELVELHCNSVARGGGGANTIQDLIQGVDLFEGQWKFMVKVFEGGGGHNWRFRFEQGGQPVFPGVISLEPRVEEPPPGARLRPGDVNGDSGFNISDPVAHLNFLFASGPLPDCYVVAGSDPVALSPAGLEVMDFNGDGSSNIADAVGALNRLFGGGGAHALGAGCADIEGDCVSNCVE